MGELPKEEHPPNALVLDDEAQVGAMVCKVLAMIGIAGEHFTDPVAFLTETKRRHPHLIVLDLALGQTDAIDVMRKLDVIKFSGLVLLISGRDESTLAEIERIGRAHGLWMVQSLRKPFRAADLKSRLQSLVRPERSQPARSGSLPPDSRPDTRIDLADALQQKQLELWYQPKLDIRSWTICGAEALIRARLPDRGLVQPIDLLPPAGDPLYKPLSIFVMQRSMADWATLSAAGHPLRLAINVPASVLNAPGFVDMVRQLIPTTPQFPGLIVEVTEDEIIRDQYWVHEVAMQLRLCNVLLSIDDFGSAYASLSRLKDLPFHEVKLDRSFVSGCADDSLKRGLCQTVVDIAHRFGATACAEGVESAEELRCLADLGFDSVQGFYFARPMPLELLIEFLAKKPGDLLRNSASIKKERTIGGA